MLYLSLTKEIPQWTVKENKGPYWLVKNTPPRERSETASSSLLKLSMKNRKSRVFGLMEVYRKAKPKYAFKMKTDEKCQNIQVLVNIVV